MDDTKLKTDLENVQIEKLALDQLYVEKIKENLELRKSILKLQLENNKINSELKILKEKNESNCGQRCSPSKEISNRREEIAA